MTFYRIRDWAKHFENNRTRELKYMDWVPVPNKHDGDGFTELLDHPEGLSHYGAWHLILQVASKCEIRGTLLRDGAVGGKRPHTPESLARITRGDEKTFKVAIDRLVSIGWIEVCNNPALSCDNPAPSCGEVTTERNGTELNGTEGNAELPTVEKAISATMNVGIPEDFCRYVYDDWATRGGKDGANIPVKWLGYVTKRWNREKQDWANGKHNGSGNGQHHLGRPLTREEQDAQTLRDVVG